jgi:hypothetical protein
MLRERALIQHQREKIEPEFPESGKEEIRLNFVSFPAAVRRGCTYT